MRRVLLISGVCCLWTWAPPLPVHAQARDVRLLEAVKRRDDKAFTALLRARADVNAAQPDGATALAWAVHLGERRMAEALLDAGANANTADEYGETPVTLAAANGDADLVRRLVAAGGTLLEAGANPNVALLSGAKPIIVAMQYRHAAAALVLLEGGADISARDRAGNTTLHLAAQAGDMNLVRALLAKRADPNARTPKSMAPVGARGGGGLGRGGMAGEPTPLMIAARGDHEDVMRALVAAGADATLRAQDGSSVLMAGASGARLKTFTYAYEIDSNVDVVTTTGNTPMHVAVGMNGRT